MAKANFTRELKKELIRKGLENACCKTAALSAFLRTTGSVLRQGHLIGFEFITESEFVAEFAIALLEDLFGAELKVVQASEDARNGRNRLVFQCLSDRSLYILSELGIAERRGDEIALNFGIDPYLIENECCRRAYVIGAFLGSGSCVLPKIEDTRSGYHLEIVFSGGQAAEDFCNILASYEILAKRVMRKGTDVVYVKSRESISDFLALMGADAALQKLDALAAQKDARNRINRVANCLQKNFDKSVLASVRQIRAIEKLSQAGELDGLDESLRKTASLRLEDREASLKELAERLNVTKSCLNHRLRKLVKIAGGLPGGEGENG